MIDLSGKKLGRLTVIKQSGRNKDKRILWLCICNCGSSVIVSGKLLNNGDTKSCGCLRQQLATKHGHSKTKTYHIWQQMIQRCYNPSDISYGNYGGRGITVCSKWLTFDNFFEDMGEKPHNRSIDRIDNDEGYNRFNCQWATPKQEAQNRRATCYVTHNSKTQC